MACGRKCSPIPSPLPSPKLLPMPTWPIMSAGDGHGFDQIYVLRVVMASIASIIGLLLLLFVVLKFIGRYYFSRRYFNRRINSPILFDIRGDSVFSDDDDGPPIMHPIWFINTVGLQQSVIDSIAIFKYRKDNGLIEGTECSVCLGEFQEDDSLRILPKCTHAFHVQCIDTWLRSRKNCPLCRAPIVRENSGREVTAVTVPELEVVGEIRMENSGGSGRVDSSQVGEGENSQLRVEDDDDSGIVAIEDGADGEVSDKNLGNCDKMNRVRRSVSVHSFPPSTFEAPTQELNSYSLHSF
ncbi:hypothetical protein QN277_026064 [Acacia crassicarpa]|uniref:RING-type E3 ubiquitin transferase n=1 Tax=Acacia crassicarpa TaxID=499986 RepID=A0AAE1MEZ9_9FABA|nr:hypothetical protein QN277_026064 [Acacia crassicarpa]